MFIRTIIIELASRIGESHLCSDAGDRFSSLRATARSPSPTTAEQQHAFC